MDRKGVGVSNEVRRFKMNNDIKSDEADEVRDMYDPTNNIPPLNPLLGFHVLS